MLLIFVCLFSLVYGTAIHREWSGLLLLATSDQKQAQVVKAIARAKASSVTHLRFYCIVNGIIAGGGDGAEQCGIRLLELDEFGKHKEPVYVAPH